jgi:alkyldihydroxyacetonephosphate synthase
MKRWNGWGEKNIYLELPLGGYDFLSNIIGDGNPQKDSPLEEIIKKVPHSRAPEHPLISTDPKKRVLYSHGQSLPDWVSIRGGILEDFPDGVAFPKTILEIEEILKFAEKNKIAVIPYGGGTSVLGHINIPKIKMPIVTISMKHINRLVNIDTYNMLATFEAGIMGPDIENKLKEKGFTLGHFPQSFEYSTLGGWIATRSSGQQSAYYGRIENLFAGGEVITPKGIMKFPTFPASAAGPDLKHILLGSEARLGIITKATVKISKMPEYDEVYGIFFPSWDFALKAVKKIAASNIPFSMIRLSNKTETAANLALAGKKSKINVLKNYLKLRGIKTDGCMCLFGITGSKKNAAFIKKISFPIFRKYKGVNIGTIMGKMWNKNRFKSAYLRNTLWDLGYAVDTLETAVNWDKVSSAMSLIEKNILDKAKYLNEKVHVFSHLSHVYKTGSSIYTTYVFKLSDNPQDTISKWKKLKDAASCAIIESEGTISHQHGVGTDHMDYLKSEKGQIGIDAIKSIYSHFDPDNMMNPLKLIE